MSNMQNCGSVRGLRDNTQAVAQGTRRKEASVTDWQLATMCWWPGGPTVNKKTGCHGKRIERAFESAQHSYMHILNPAFLVSQLHLAGHSFKHCLR
jgi:hypothetical protein